MNDDGNFDKSQQQEELVWLTSGFRERLLMRAGDDSDRDHQPSSPSTLNFPRPQQPIGSLYSLNKLLSPASAGSESLFANEPPSASASQFGNLSPTAMARTSAPSTPVSTSLPPQQQQPAAASLNSLDNSTISSMGFKARPMLWKDLEQRAQLHATTMAKSDDGHGNTAPLSVVSPELFMRGQPPVTPSAPSFAQFGAGGNFDGQFLSDAERMMARQDELAGSNQQPQPPPQWAPSWTGGLYLSSPAVRTTPWPQKPAHVPPPPPPPPGFESQVPVPPPLTANAPLQCTTRHLLVGVEPNDHNERLLQQFAEALRHEPAGTMKTRQGVVMIFFDLRSVEHVARELRKRNATATLKTVRPVEDLHVSEDRVVGRVLLFGLTPRHAPSIENIMKGFGEVKECAVVESTTTRALFAVEYWDARDAAYAVQNLRDKIYDGYAITAKLWPKHLPYQSLMQEVYGDAVASTHQQQRPSAPTSSTPQPMQPRLGPLEFQVSARQRQSQPLPSPASAYQDGGDELKHVVAAAQSSSGNQIDLMAILEGRDTRTTFMIRNIPNKYTQEMLLDLINETHRGHYDFLYLRMDFKNRCNVGYAFINFIDPKSAVSFAMRCCGKKWAKFNSEKVCALSYANIQGKADLISKFRDSHVMLEDASYRPKIFYSSGASKGEEEPFPAPTQAGVRRLLQSRNSASSAASSSSSGVSASVPATTFDWMVARRATAAGKIPGADAAGNTPSAHFR